MEKPEPGEMSHTMKQSADVRRDHEADLKRGTDHLRDHHRETARVMDRGTERNTKKDR